MSDLSHPPPLRQINLFNPSLVPAKEYFSARSVALWIVVALIAMVGVAWWAFGETQKLRQQAAEQAARRADQSANKETAPSLQQLAAMEQSLKTKQALLQARRTFRDGLKRGMVTEGGGPSATLRLVAATVPPQVWLTDLNASGGRIELSGRTVDPAALNAWLAHLNESRQFAAKPISTVRVENGEFAAAPATGGSPPPRAGREVYAFSVSAALVHPFADDGGRAP